ncbi:Uncharacterized protein dnm_044150 [Desulfonema magnum]|uniref:Uncharacterized protein n=2 Tax=Desulfonema magnum TaxID=45655 RepID=A0A975BMU9_9BACT|nr:Uncharacterized protein dnm_044150 [Desulfonema magnum]
MNLRAFVAKKSATYDYSYSLLFKHALRDSGMIKSKKNRFFIREAEPRNECLLFDLKSVIVQNDNEQLYDFILNFYRKNAFASND